MAPLLGGVLIGISSTMILLFLGKIAGVSGILGTLLSSSKNNHHWKVSFLIGLIFGGSILKFWSTELFNYSLNFNTIQIQSKEYPVAAPSWVVLGPSWL